MIRQRTHVRLMATAVIGVAFTVMFLSWGGTATARQDQGKPQPDDLAEQVKELRQQIAELKTHVNAAPSPRIMAAGTATFVLGAMQDNATNVRVKLSAEIAAKLGDDYLVLLTNRFPTGGYPFFAPYWKKAGDGFDITLVDVTLGPNSSSSYLYNKNKTFLIDWIVVKK